MSILILLAISWATIQALAGYTSVEQSESDRFLLKRGVIISIEEIGVKTRAEIAAQLTDEGIPGVPEFGVKLYRVIYQTIDVNGRLIHASGAVAIPLNLEGPAPLLSYQHGTVTARDRVPSEQGFDLVSMGMGGSGYVTALPDYIGLGASDTFHPYVHAKSLGNAVVDMLRATRQLCEDIGVTLNDQLFLVGYSEGGFATMAAHREIEQHYADEFTVTASAPMAGPYNLSEVMVDQILDASVYPSPGYLPYTLLSYNRVYDLFDMQHVFREPYATQIDGLFDGVKTLRYINKQLPAIPMEMLNEKFVSALETESHPLLEILKENDVHNWAPVAPMRLFHCVEDDQVSFRNAEVALEAFQDHGADHVELAALEFGGHEACAPPALFLGKLWLDEFKEDRAPSILQANIKILKAGTF
ncbi:MAG: lipase family protein [Rhodothermales bacterium]